jgi:hypothetical protein
MKWLERLRARTATPTGDALTKLTKVLGAGAVSLPSGGAMVVSAWQDPSPLETKAWAVPTGHMPVKRSPATATIRSDLDRAGKPIAALQLGSLTVPYQRIWYDFGVADGAYTPGELRRAKKVVRPWGPVTYYTLQWPALEAGAFNPPLRSSPENGLAPRA